MDFTQVLAVTGIVASNLATVIALHFQLDRKIEVNRAQQEQRMQESRKETNAILQSIQAEIKDFHGKLCAIEERTRK